jgi:transposase
MAEDAAVQAAVTLPWGQGPTAGLIHRLKRLKRQMFGRGRLRATFGSALPQIRVTVVPPRSDPPL